MALSAEQIKRVKADEVYRQIYESALGGLPPSVPVEVAEQMALRFYFLLQNTLSWDTTCVNCSRLLDSSYEQFVRREQAEEALSRANKILEEASIPPIAQPLPEEPDCYD